MIQSLSEPFPPPIRIGLIGLGNTGRIHLQHLLSIPNTVVVAVAETTPVPEEARIAGVRYHRDYDDVIESSDIDAVVITLPHILHADPTGKALRAGKHVFLEKPIATTYKEARELVACAEACRRTLMVNMTHRFYPPMRKGKELLASGIVGEIMCIRDYYMEVINRAEFPGWFFDPYAAGGGVAMTDTVHLIDRVEWLIDEKMRTLGAHGKRVSQDIDVEDSVEFLCTTPSGIPITIGSFFCFDGPKAYGDGLVVYGSRGVLEIRAWSHVEWRPYGGEAQRFEGYPGHFTHHERACVGHRAALTEFIASLHENRPSESEGKAVLNAQKVVEAFYELHPLETFQRAVSHA